MENQSISFAIPSHSEGRFADVTDAGRVAVDVAARETGTPAAYGEIVWARHPDAGVKFAAQERGRRWQESPVTGVSSYKP
jgi:hypothetical protein